MRLPALVWDFLMSQLIFYPCVLTYHDKDQGTRGSLQKQTKWPIELRTLKHEMETDDDSATMRESFSLVQNMLLIDYTDILPAHE